MESSGVKYNYRHGSPRGGARGNPRRAPRISVVHTAIAVEDHGHMINIVLREKFRD